MKIGILECDKVRESLVGKYGSYPDMFAALLRRADASISLEVYDVTANQLPGTIHDCDGYLITGSKYSVYEDLQWIEQLSEFVVQLNIARKKLVGICFGHQLIAQALGGKVAKYAGGWGVGIQQYSFKMKPGWILTDQEDFSLLATHQDQVIEMPEKAVLIAGNAFCKNAMFCIEDHILTVQAHPEFCSDYCRQLIEIRREMIGEDVSVAALASLDEDHEGDQFACWLVDFMKN